MHYPFRKYLCLRSIELVKKIFPPYFYSIKRREKNREAIDLNQ
jgi:hypothetical protein